MLGVNWTTISRNDFSRDAVELYVLEEPKIRSRTQATRGIALYNLDRFSVVEIARVSLTSGVASLPNS